MRRVRLSSCGLIVILFLAVWNVGQAQDSLGMRCLSGLDYWQYVDHIQMVGNLAYIVAGISGLHIMNLEDPANPVEIGRFTWYQMSETGGHFYVLGNLVYLGIETGGFVLDVSDPTHPIVLGQWISTIGSGISFAHDNYAVAQTEEDYPYVLDISDPTNVHQIGEIPHSGPQRGVGMAGEYLCMTGNPGGLVLFDMSNPAEPQWVSSIDTTFLTHYAAISGNYGYVATLYNGLRIIDLSNPLQPIEVAACDNEGRTEDVTVTGFHAVTKKSSSLVSDHWLNIWNVMNPTNPVLEGTIHLESLGWSRISASGSLVCAAARPYYAVIVVDISNPEFPVQVSSFGPVGRPIRTNIYGNTAYLADYYMGLRIVDITTPYHISEIAHADGGRHIGTDVAIRGDYAYVIENFNSSNIDPIVVFDISNPAEPESLGYALYDNAGRIVVEEDYAYVARLNQIATFSLANPAQPQCVNVLDLPFAYTGLGLAAGNGYLYYGDVTGFYVCSLSNPAAPEIAGSCNLSGGSVVDLAVDGNYVYAAGGYGGIRIVDVSNPVNPYEVNWINGYWVQSVAASGNIAIMDDLTRISIYDVTDPLDPRLEGYYSTAERIYDMEMQGQYLFTTSMSEFRVYECDALPSAVQPHESFPIKFSLLPPYPNPFNSVLTIPFDIPVQEEVKISIYNILGQRVQEFDFDPLTPGVHRVLWNPRVCASSIYFVRMTANDTEYWQKVVLLK